MRAAHLTCRSPSDAAEDRIAQQDKNGSGSNLSTQLACKHRWGLLESPDKLGRHFTGECSCGVQVGETLSKSYNPVNIASSECSVGLPVTFRLFLPGYAIYQLIRS